jgi:tetraacyldisaccharide 4'-kinase
MGIDWQKIWREKGTEAILLLPLAALYASGWVIYQLLYWLGIKKAERPHRPVVCVGNLIAGGAGKTPVTLFVARTLHQLGRPVVVSLNGYRSPRQDNAHAAPDGPLDAREWGDEAALVREKLPGVPLIVGRDRVRAAQICRDLHPQAVLLLDDGFQHLPLHKDVTIVLDPPDLENRWPMPSGPYREPRSTGLQRATTVVPGEFRLSAPMVSLRDAKGESVHVETPVNALCAVARPERFIDVLEQYQIRVAHEKLLPDHDDLRDKRLFLGFDPNLPVVVTEKDWVKLRERRDLDAWTVLVASYEVQLEPADTFRLWLRDKLDEVRD